MFVFLCLSARVFEGLRVLRWKDGRCASCLAGWLIVRQVVFVLMRCMWGARHDDMTITPWWGLLRKRRWWVLVVESE